ncbi:MAG: hypothetical protein RLY30_1036 [Pseudomonadota bacterium]
MSEFEGYSLVDYFDAVVRAHPDRSAVYFGEQRLSFQELSDLSWKAAACLSQSGVRDGETVGLHLFNRPEYIAAFYGACRIGAIPFNVNYRYGRQELAYLYADAQARAVFCEEDLLNVAQAACAEAGLSCPLITIDALRASDGPGFLATAAQRTIHPSGQDLSLLYTGGTTGMPKGVMWRHTDLYHGALGSGALFLRCPPLETPQALEVAVSQMPDLRYLAIAPLMHGAAFWSSLITLHSGLGLVLMPDRQFRADSVLDTLERERVNILAVVGDAMAVPLLDAFESAPGRWDLSNLMHWGNGGAVLSAATKARIRALFPRIQIGDGMGSSESGILGSGDLPPDASGLLRLPARADVKVIVDRQRLARPGEQGMLARTGPIPLGYWRDEQKTRENFILIEGQRYVLSGDAAIQDPDGSVVLLGRDSQCVNTGGEKVFVEEVETQIKTHPGVLDCNAVGVPDPKWGQKLVALVSLRSSEASSGLSPDRLESELIQLCRSSLAAYKAPKRIWVVPEIPRGANGKADYRWAKAAALDLDQGTT